MNYIKKIIQSCILFSMFKSYPAVVENSDTNQPVSISAEKQSTIIDDPAILSINNEIKKKDIDDLSDTTRETNITKDTPTTNESDQKKELIPWNKHLEKLLTENKYWDSSSQVPTDEWQTYAFDIAKSILKNSITFADDLKSSFFNTINQKFLTIEKAADLEGVLKLIIQSFNTKIDSFIQEISPLKEDEKINSETKTAIKTTTPTVKLDNQDKPEESKKLETDDSEKDIPEEKTTDASIEKKILTQEEKQKIEWDEIVKDIGSEGITKSEIKNIIDDAIEIAEHIIHSQPKELQLSIFNTLINEFQGALDSRRYSLNKKLYQINQSAVIQQFQELNPFISDQSFDNDDNFYPTAPNDDSFATSKLSYSPNYNKEKLKEAALGKSKQERPASGGMATESIAIKNTEKGEYAPMAVKDFKQGYFQFENSATAKNRKKIVNEKEQLLLAKNIQQAAIRKAIADKANAEKGILSSIAEAVLGDWWTSSNNNQKTVSEFREKQKEALVEMINKLHDPFTNKLLDSDAKERIKTAYYKFEEVLLAFNSKEFWNSNSKIPNEKWEKKIKTSAVVLALYEVMTIDSIISLLHETLKSKMVSDKLELLEKKIRNHLDTEKKNAIQYKENEISEQRRKQKEIIKNQSLAIEKEQFEKEQKKESLIQQKKQKKEEMQRVENEKIRAQGNFTKLNNEWHDLLKSIASSTNSSTEQNNRWTQQALEHTKSMVDLASIIGIKKEEIIQNNITDFSKALIQQKHDDTFNFNTNLEHFNKNVHVLK